MSLPSGGSFGSGSRRLNMTGGTFGNSFIQSANESSNTSTPISQNSGNNMLVNITLPERCPCNLTIRTNQEFKNIQTCVQFVPPCFRLNVQAGAAAVAGSTAQVVKTDFQTPMLIPVFKVNECSPKAYEAMC